MSELKPCPVTQIQAYRAYEKLLEIMEDETDDQTEAFSAAYKALYWIANDYRAQPENKPLTIEQLREMEWYEPVYVKFKHAIPSKVVRNLYDCLCYIGASESNYGKTWLAYRRPPERFIGVDLASGHDFTAYGRKPEGE